MGQPIQPEDLQFTTREYYLDGGDDYASGQTLSFEQLDTTLIFLSNSIANIDPTVNINTGSLLLTASATLNTIEFTKADGTPFTVTIDTGSGQTYTEGNGIDINGSNIVSARLGAGLRFDGSTQIEATVRQVNGQEPNAVTGNVATALTAVETGISSSLVASSSGAITGSILNGTVWVISGDGDATKNGDTYIFKSGSIGQWYQISPLDEVAGDARYVRLSATSTQNITSSLLISGSTTFTGSLSWSGSSNANGAAANVVVLSNGQLYITGAYGSGGGATPGGADKTIQFNDGGSTLSGSGTFTFDKNTNTVSISGSLLSTGSLVSSGSLRVIGTGSITGSLTISSSTNGQTVLQVTGTGSLTSPPLVQIAGGNGGFVQVYDSNSGSLFSVNGNTGTAIVDVRSNGQTLIGSNTYQGAYDSVGIASFSGPTQSLLIPGYLTSSFNMILMDYVAISGSYGKIGTLTGIMSGSIVDSAAPAARTFGTSPTNNINFGVSMSGQYYTIIATSDVNGWFIKGIVRAI